MTGIGCGEGGESGGKGFFEWMLEGMESRSRNREKRQRDGKDPGNKFVVIINIAT